MLYFERMKITWLDSFMTDKPYTDRYHGLFAEVYDIMQNWHDDVPFFTKMIKKYGEPILEIGSGTGRTLIPLAAKNIRITGIEPSRDMLEICKQKMLHENLSDIDILNIDAGSFRLEETFRLIYFTCNTFKYFLTRAKQIEVLQNVKKHLHPDGRLIIDLTLADLPYMVKMHNQDHEKLEYEDPLMGYKIVQFGKSEYDFINQIEKDFIMIEKWDDDNLLEVAEAEITITYFFPREIMLLLEHCQFQIENVYTDYHKTVFKKNAQNLIIIASAKNL